VTCSRCGNASEQVAIGSTNRMGSPDLDLRPPPMERDTIDAWIQDCRTCGYVASDLSDRSDDRMEAAMESDAYRSLAAVPGSARPRVASAFRRRALLDAATGNRALAGRALLYASWALDDARDATAATCRREAAGHLLASIDAGRGSFQQRLQVVDILRRAAQFEDASEQADIVIADLDAGSPLGPIVAYQKRLIARSDDTCHTIADVHQGN